MKTAARHLGGYALSLSACALGCSASDRDARQQGLAHDEQAPSAEHALALRVTPAQGQAAPALNPFVGAEFFRDPRHVQRVLATIEAAPARAELLRRTAEYPTALWLDRIQATRSLSAWLKQAQDQEQASGKPAVPVLVVYDLPNRDCAARASGGELHAQEDGEQRYRREFIDPIHEALKQHDNQRVVIVLEPDSLANMATNMNVPKCAASAELYKRSVAYAISKLSLPNVYLYLDAAHAGWLGWDANRRAIAEIFKEVLTMAGGIDRIRGFATNVSNYNALDGEWGWQLESSNPCPNEYCYVQKLDESLREVGIEGKGYIIDTSRNGIADARTRWGHWCNIKGAGLGARPEVAPRPLVDAFYWVKPPGDSDGIADPEASRFDEACASVDSAEQAPEAGAWFASYFLGLVERANPPL